MTTTLGAVTRRNTTSLTAPCQGTLVGADGHRLYRTTLEYTRHSNLNSFREEVGEGWLGSTHKTSYTYDIDNRVTEMQFDDSLHKIALHL